MIVNKPHHNTYFGIPLAYLVGLLLCIATLAVYWQVKDCGFIWDDFDYVVKNHHIQNGLTFKSLTWSFISIHSSNWHPLTWMSHILDIHLFGMTPGNHHLTNVFFHIANTLLLFFVLRRMTETLWQSAFVAALFALHPLHVESVAWVAERKDVLSTFFWMLTLWSYAGYVKYHGIGRYVQVVLFFILGLMAKPMLVTLPFVLLLLDYWPLNRFQTEKHGIRQLILEKTPLFALSAASCAMTSYAQHAGGAVSSLSIYSLSDRIANALVSYVAYIIKMIWPFNLSVQYPYPETLPLWQIAGAGFFLLSLSIPIIMAMRKRPYLAVGWLWYMGTLVPVIGIMQVGSQAMADRYTYIPLTGLFIMTAWGIPELFSQWRHKERCLAITTSILLIILMATTLLQVRYWTNGITLFEHALKVTKDNAMAHYNLAHIFVKKNKRDEALTHFREVLRLDPGDYETYFNMGGIFINNGRVDEGMRHLFHALRINPGFHEAHYLLGLTLAKQNKLDEAVIHLSQALRISPNNAKAHYNLGLAYAKQGKMDAAIQCFSDVLRIDPDNAEVHNNLGIALVKKGNMLKAVRHFQEALRIDPRLSNAQNHLKKTQEFPEQTTDSNE